MILDLHNQIIYDWLSFTTKIHNLTEVLDLLDFRPDTIQFKEQDFGRYRYRKSLYYDGITIYYDGFDKDTGDMGICVEMSGKGLRNWEEYSYANYDKIFDLILRNYDPDPAKCRMRVTRLDVAYDDFEGVLDIEHIAKETKSCHLVTRLKGGEIHDNFLFTGESRGLTVDIGSMKSNVFIRIYDKRCQMKVQDYCNHWIRCEIQLRDENAMGFVMLKSPVEKSYFDVLNNYLRYIVYVDDSSDSNKRRQVTAPFWLNFIQSAESKSIFHKPKNDYRVENFMNYVNVQLSASVSTYIDLVGVDTFLKNMYDSRKGKQLNPKYKVLKEKYDANTNGILEYLKEKGID